MDVNNRRDKELAFMLRIENVAWYEDGCVRILDRRVYPMETRYKVCSTYEEVARCIKEMVTQSEGPYAAAAMGMILAARQCKDKKEKERLSFMRKAARSLSTARPTTTKQMQSVTGGAFRVYEENTSLSFNEMEEKLFNFAYNYLDDKYRRYTLIGEALSALVVEGGGVLTHCFPGTVIGTFLRALRERGKTAKIFCTETRPYFQGSRLTASVACDMGFDVKVITDGMAASVLSQGLVNLFTTASDVITMDGHVINKVGTLEIAIASHYFNVPYYVTGTPDARHKDTSTIRIEEREGKEVLCALDRKIAMDGVSGLYPAFDITPPSLVSGVVTDKGLLKASEMDKYFL